MVTSVQTQRSKSTTFAALFRYTSDYFSSRAGKREGRVRSLPPTLRQLADEIELTSQFQQLAVPLFEGKSEPSRWTVSDTLRRSGFYQAVILGEKPGVCWRRIRRFFKNYEATIRNFVLLDCCVFPKDRFDLLGFQVRRFSKSEIERFGPSPDIARMFFPREYLDPDWYTQQWFLCDSSKVRRGPTIITARFGVDLVSPRWQPLLALALYSLGEFRLPVYVESERDRDLTWVLAGTPLKDTLDDEGNTLIPVATYHVADREARRFAHFLRTIGRCITVCGADDSFLKRVARRYLRGCLTDTSRWGEDGAFAEEDALLQYMFALETLLLAKGEKEGIADKIATRGAHLAGAGSDERRSAVFQALKRFYSERSEIVHGGSKGASASKGTHNVQGLRLGDIRDVARHIILAALALRREVDSTAAWRDAIRDLPISVRWQRRAAVAGWRVFRSIQC